MLLNIIIGLTFFIHDYAPCYACLNTIKKEAVLIRMLLDGDVEPNF